MLKKNLIAFAAICLGLCIQAQNYTVFGTHDRANPVYEAGEKMVFTIKLLAAGKPVAGPTLKWQRTGDDGIVEDGEAVLTEEGCQVVASTDKPGFVRIYATVWQDGKQLKSPKDKRGRIKPLFFDGGACVAPDTLQGLPEPKDFDQYWAKQKALLASVPMKVLEKKEAGGNDKVDVYDMKIACAGGMPVSGYLTVPKGAKAKSLAGEVAFRGYGVSGASRNLGVRDRVYFQINAHGIENGKPAEYYQELGRTKLRSYAFSMEENSSVDTTYFNGMYLRIMRALEFVKSLPEWNGKELRATGGSQGGMQSLVAAGIDTDVTYCHAWSPWCCDFGRTELGRIVGGWYIKYTPALEYYDPINHIKRANPGCKLEIIANLGDYVCPPSGVWIAFNNFPGKKTLLVRQGCEHGYRMPNFPEFKIEKPAK